MYFKLATKNIKKSYKDYTIYFLTLILAVCIFYSFNSIDSQKAFVEMKDSGQESIPILMNILSSLSTLVSIILGSLILYANNFLVKNRKKELGLYMILGMGKRKISKILVAETFIVGCISLIAGLILGIGASQGLSTFALKLFNVGIEEYSFAISGSAIGKTILYFGIMFLLVMIFNVFVISKYKIIDLLTAGRKNENIKFKNPFIYLISFGLCVILLGFSYKTLLKIGLDTKDNMFTLSIVLSIIGTVLFFFSLSGVILYLVNKNKNLYFKGLNIFVIKQINSKVITNFISMSLICIMLFTTMIVLSTGIGFKKGFDANLKKSTPFDSSIRIINNSKEDNIEEILNKIDFKKDENEEYAFHNEYLLGVKTGDLLKTTDEDYKDFEWSFIKESDYNKMLKIRGEQEINLSENEILLMSTSNNLNKSINENLKHNKEANIKGKEFLIKNDKVIDENLYNWYTGEIMLTIVIKDDFLSDYNVISNSVLNIMYSDNDREKHNKTYSEIDENDLNGEYKSLNIPPVISYTKDYIYDVEQNTPTIMVFVGVYLGIVFLISSMAMLSLQQLSEASDSIERYRALKRIGANKKMIDKTIFIQTLIYFSLPVILALIHLIIGSILVNNELGMFSQNDSIFSALIFIGVYIVYFYTTYIGYKNIVKNVI